MGRQVNFFVDEKDEQEMLETMQKAVPMDFYYGGYDRAPKRPLGVLPPQGARERDWKIVVFN
jgi:hypothetical protein